MNKLYEKLKYPYIFYPHNFPDMCGSRGLGEQVIKRQLDHKGGVWGGAHNLSRFSAWFSGGPNCLKASVRVERPRGWVIPGLANVGNQPGVKLWPRMIGGYDW